MKYCKNCGATLNDDAEFCTDCGNKVESSTAVVSSGTVESYEFSDVKQRNIVVAVILTIVTCGLYSLYWTVKLNNEALELSGEKGPSGGLVILLTIITCGIYSYIWWYKMGVCVDKMNSKEGNNTSIIYLLLTLFGFSFVNYILAQLAINDRVGK